MMKTNNIARRLLVLQALIGFLLVSCVNEHEYDTPKLQGKEEATITFSLSVPGNSGSVTRGLSENDETNVETIDVLLFRKDDSDNRLYWDKVLGVSLDNTSGSVKSFSAVIPVRDYSNYDITIVANARQVVLGAGLTRGESKAATLDRLVLDISGNADHKWETNNIPMWGEALNMDVNESTNLSGSNAVRMTRMISRIDVKLSKKAATGSDDPSATGNTNFSLASVRLYNYSTKGTVAPDAGNPLSWSASENKAITPHQPVGGYGKAQYPTVLPLLYTNSDQHSDDSFMPDSLIRAIYTFEALAGSNSSLSTNTCLVIGGNYQSGGETYYRIDFAVKNDATQQYDYLNLLRNHNYVINITKITGAGFSTPEEAFSSRPVNIEAEVIDWNERGMGNAVFDGQYMMSISHDELRYYSNGREQQIRIYTDVPTGWKVVSSPDWVTVSQDTGQSGQISSVGISCDAGPSDDRNGYVVIEAGRLNMKIDITQIVQPELTLEVSEEMVTFRKTVTTEKIIKITSYPVDALRLFSVSGDFVWDPAYDPEGFAPNLETYAFKPQTNNEGKTLKSFVTVMIQQGDKVVTKMITFLQLAHDLLFNYGNSSKPAAANTAATVDIEAERDWKVTGKDDPHNMLSLSDYGTHPANWGSPYTYTFGISDNLTWSQRTATIKVNSDDPEFVERDVLIVQDHDTPKFTFTSPTNAILDLGTGNTEQTASFTTNSTWKYTVDAQTFNKVVASVDKASSTNHTGGSPMNDLAGSVTFTPVIYGAGIETPAAGTLFTKVRFETTDHESLSPGWKDLTIQRTVPGYWTAGNIPFTPNINSDISSYHGAIIKISANTNGKWMVSSAVSAGDNIKPVTQNASQYGAKTISYSIPPHNNGWGDRTVTLKVTNECNKTTSSAKFTQIGFYLYDKEHSVPSFANLASGGAVRLHLSGCFPANWVRVRMTDINTATTTSVVSNVVNVSRGGSLVVSAGVATRTRTSGHADLTLFNNGTGANRIVYLQYQCSIDGTVWPKTWTTYSSVSQPAGSIILPTSKRAVAKYDTNVNGQAGQGHGKMNWVQAMGMPDRYNTEYLYKQYPNGEPTNRHYPFVKGYPTGCAAYSEPNYPAGTWRVPTLSELLEMWELRTQIRNLHPSNYISSSEVLEDRGGGLRVFNIAPDGSTGELMKTANWYVRCVRDN